MGGPFGTRHSGPRTVSERRELALDLTADEVVLHEGNTEIGWHRFAGVAGDDPEFLEIIGLFRTEVEEMLGGLPPVRLWLPAEQVLAVSMSLDETDPEARLRTAFDRIEDKTGHQPEDVALAVAPAHGAAPTRLLVTFAETLYEARDYAARWGFVPGPVSTRHHAADFAPAEPVFRLRETTAKATPPADRPAARMAFGVVAGLVAALTAYPAATAQAPQRAPVPVARADDPGWVRSVTDPESRPSQLAFIPPSRTEIGEVDGRTAPLPPVTEKAAPTLGTGLTRPAPNEATDPAGKLAAPVPVARPQRTPAPAKTSPGAALPVIRASAPARAVASERTLPSDRVALLGILDLDSGREALIRLPDGAFRRVRVGDEIEGWRVNVIGLDAMRVSHGGSNRTLLLVTR